MILTVDLGTSFTKVALWNEEGLVTLAEVPIDTVHREPGWSEQDPSGWHTSVVRACAQVRSRDPVGFDSVAVIGCTGARQTLALVDAAGAALGPGILWSDRRAATEAASLTRALEASPGPPAGPAPGPGIPVDAASVAAKLAWLAVHDGQRLGAAAWILTPRDLIAFWLTGEVATDASMASRSGLYDMDDRLIGELAEPVAAKLPPVVPSDRIVGGLAAPAAAALGLLAGTPVVIGAADRPCEVLGTAATETCPMVSWGTTANVSLPVSGRPAGLPPGPVFSRAADGGWLMEAGLSAAGSFVAWLGRLTGQPPARLADLAGQSPPGARGVVATPWLDGARAPWWRPDAGAAFVGLASAHGPADLARAVFESVAWEVNRCLGALASRPSAGPPVAELALAGRGAAIPVWLDVLTGVTGLPVRCRRSGQAASVGAALLAATAVGIECDLDHIDPVDTRVEPDLATVALYAGLQGRAEGVAARVIDLDPPPPPRSPPPSNRTAVPGGPSCG